MKPNSRDLYFPPRCTYPHWFTRANFKITPLSLLVSSFTEQAMIEDIKDFLDWWSAASTNTFRFSSIIFFSVFYVGSSGMPFLDVGKNHLTMQGQNPHKFVDIATWGKVRDIKIPVHGFGLALAILR